MSVRRLTRRTPRTRRLNPEPLESRILFIATAGDLLVNVDATTLPAGDATTVLNTGTLGGNFLGQGTTTVPVIGQPVATATAGTRGIRMDGTNFLQLTDPDSGSFLPAPAGVTGPDPTLSVEAWAWNPGIAGEETMFAWGRRGDPAGSNMSFNYGSNGDWGAVGHWGAQDIGWGPNVPAARQWHHLAYTYDGTTSRVYVDGVLTNSETLAPGAINIVPNTPMYIGSQTEPDGVTPTPGLRGSLTVAKVRVDDGVLTDAQILANYNEEKASFVEPTLPTAPLVKLVDIDPTTLPEGPITSLTNTGTSGGSFQPTGGGDTTPTIDQPLTTATSGTKGIRLDGNDFLQQVDPDGFVTPAPASVTGPDPKRSIEVWAWNPGISDEETMVSWGHRGGPDGSNMSFNYGSSPNYGAVGHWGSPDIGWGAAPPAARQWHHLVYTYDGSTTRVYIDGQLANSEILGEGVINTWANNSINIGTQLDANGTPTAGLRGTLTLGRVRVYSGVLTDAQIQTDYNAEKAGYVEPGEPPPPPPAVKLVDIDATTLPVGTPANDIPNTGPLGGVFEATGGNERTVPVVAAPLTSTTTGTPGIRLDGNDFLQLVSEPGGSLVTAPASITGPNPKHSIETWVYNPGIAYEETMVSFGRRGGNPDGSNMSFNYGSSPDFGAVGHWGSSDIGWGSTVPAAQQWHHLVYTYDGETTRVYADGVLANSELLGEGAINTAPDTPINIGTQMDNATVPTNFLRGSLTLGKVRIYSGVLTDAQIAANYNAEKGGFVNPTTPPAPASLTAGPTHRYSFNNAAGDATGGAVTDTGSAATPDSNGVVQGAGATFSGNRLVLPGGPSATASYVDLPNGLISSNGAVNGGTGQLTLEGWVRQTGSQSWSRIYDLGSNTTGEITGPGGGGNGSDFVMLTAQTGGVPVHRFEVTDAGNPLNRWDENTSAFNNQDLHFVLTWDEATGKVRYYENGKEVGGLDSGVLMSDINDVNDWLGRSQFTADANFQGEYDEFRVYNRVLTPAEVTGDFQAGPDVVTAGQQPVSDVYVRGSAWSTSFKQYLEAKGLGDDVYGYKVFGNGAPVAGPPANPDQILPWINVNEVVLKYATAPTGSGVPQVGNVAITSQRGVTYTITSVTPVAGDPTAFVVTFNQPLGGGNPTTGVAPTANENGDRITVGVPVGSGGANFNVRMSVLQGDTDHTGESGTHSVLAADFSAVKKKFFKSTADPVTGADTDYSVYHDVNGSGDILANDFSEVKKRFFQQMPPPPPESAGALALSGVTKDLFGSTAIL
jgi:hypothetical protein